MPSNRRHSHQTQPKTTGQNDAATTQEQDLEAGTGPVEGSGPEHGAGETPTPTAVAENAVQEGQSSLSMTVLLHTGAPVEDMVATADVTLGDVCTIRNVKIKEDDYGLKVVMPRTKMPDTGRFKDACYFHSPELREQFDTAVKEAYQQALEPAQEQGGLGGMTL